MCTFSVLGKCKIIKPSVTLPAIIIGIRTRAKSRLFFNQKTFSRRELLRYIFKSIHSSYTRIYPAE